MALPGQGRFGMRGRGETPLDIAAYLDEVPATFANGHATEHSYRPALEKLFQSIDPELEVINEPKRSEGGMPEFLFQRDGVPIVWAEAKDIDKDLITLKGCSVEQRKRYEKAYPNLIYTNGVDFKFILIVASLANTRGQKAKWPLVGTSHEHRAEIR